MSNEPLKFWITCPSCKQPFGVEPRAILQYLNRVLDARMGERAEPAEPFARAVPPAPAGEPTPPPSKAMPTLPTGRQAGRQAPYKPAYRKWKR